MLNKNRTVRTFKNRTINSNRFQKIIITIIISLVLIGLRRNVFAADKYNSTSNVNGVTANWEYKLNSSNQIEDLKCTNSEELKGDIIIPSTIDGKTVTSIGMDGFKSATSITGVTFPDSIKKIELWAFIGCTSLSKVDFGSVEKIAEKAFQDCTSLTKITIPKTLNKGTSGSPFLGCNNLKNIEFEDGITIIPDYICGSTPIEEITVPNSVKEIGIWAFSNCTSLKKITILDNVEKMDGDWYNYIFDKHNPELTVYCYKDSAAAKYAEKFNIKCVYLEKNTKTNKINNEENKKNENKENANKENENKGLISKENLPIIIGVGIGVLVLLAIIIIFCILKKKK